MPSSKPPPSIKGVADNPGLLEAILASAVDYAIITTDVNGTIVTWNKGAEHIFGHRSSEILGKPLALIFTPEDKAYDIPAKEMSRARMDGRSADIRWHQRQDGTVFWGDGVMTPIVSNGIITGFLKILRDETERKRDETELARIARVDMLTGVGNRAALRERLAEVSATALRNGDLIVLHMLDLDGFKQVNDNWGHQTGDKLLQQVSARIREVTRDADFVARLGGDEFIVLQTNVHSPEAGAALSAKLVEVLSHPFQIDGNEILAGVSIGIAVFPRDASSQDQLLRKADLALYKVKSSGTGGYHFFSEQLDIDAHNKERVITALKRAVATRDFQLVYQPEIDSETGATVAVEALLRCHDPLLANLPVEDIVTLAANCNVMLDIGLWVLKEACTQSRKWRDQGLPAIRMCINLCPRELLDPGLASQVELILKKSDLSGRDLEVEITERDAFESNGQGLSTVTQLRSLGVSIAIDDFGTGYSALSQLRWLPVDKVKLDRSFVTHIPVDTDSCSIVSAIVSLAHTLRLEVIVEGVESSEQNAFFKRARCKTLQGFYFSRPLSGEALGAWLAHQRPLLPGTGQGAGP